MSLLSSIDYQLFTRPGTGSVLATTGQTHHLVAGWRHLDPWLVGFGLGAVPIPFFFDRLRPVASPIPSGC